MLIIASFISTSKFYTSAMLMLRIVGKSKVQTLGRH